jgi:ABC-2 type transport system permease protein
LPSLSAPFKFPVLLRRDVSELISSRAFWLLLLIIGPLVGQGFIVAVNSYAEASGIGGGPAALSQGLTPLDGLLAPTLGAYDLAATLLLPFVVIRIVSAEKESGALKLILQWPITMADSLFSKAVAICLAWFMAMFAAFVALILWNAYGGHLYAPETLNIFAGYFLRMLLTTALATAAAAVLPGAANAAIVVLGFTVGTWALDFVAAGRGGLLETVAAYTPAAALRNFEHGLLSLDVVLVVLILSLLGFFIAGIWLHIGNTVRRRIAQTAFASVIAAVCIFAAAHIRTSYDFSENRRNSFALEDEHALASLSHPLVITAYLAAEDPRLTDYQRNVLTKLRRAVPKLTVVYPLQGRSGLFEANNRYGEIWYDFDGRRQMSRSTTDEIVLETIYQLAAQTPHARTEASFSGYPLAHRPTAAAWIFYFVWPITIVAIWWLTFRRTQS